jgi:predicted ABC-type exoprotein transport system permease subunit
MKFVKTAIFALYLIIYGYAVWMTSIEPNNVIWGYLCVAIFGFLFIWTISIIIKNSNNSEKL